VTTTPAARDHQSLLEAALLDVHALLADLLVASDEQYAAVVARDHAWLENVTRQQERLSSRLERAESKRVIALGGLALADAIALLPADQALRTKSLSDSIAVAVNQLKQRQDHTASLLEQSIEVVGHTLNFLQRLVTVQSPAYGARGVPPSRQSLLVDGRA
jgi:flagellar biosynthesis/type III secretory pathway chaperone